MANRWLACAALGALVAVGSSGPRPAHARAEAESWEVRAVKALVADDANALPALAAVFRKVPAEERRALPLVVRDDAVEFAFRGEVLIADGIDFVEFLIAGAAKDYEALVVAPKGELERLAALAPYFNALPMKDRRNLWRARLSWVEDGRARSSDLGDVFGLLSARDRAEFLDGQEVDSDGQLGGEGTTGKNVRCDRAALPAKSAAVVLHLTLTRAPQK